MKDIDRVIREAKEGLMPFESWERLPRESAMAFAAFCVFRDLGAERNIRKAAETALNSIDKNEGGRGTSYRMWRNWSTQFRWKERAADFDRYLENLKQTELRKTIEAQGEKHREVTGKMLDVVIKKLDTMNPEDLTQGNVPDWVQTAIKADREVAGLVNADGKAESKQGELAFVSDFNGL